MSSEGQDNKKQSFSHPRSSIIRKDSYSVAYKPGGASAVEYHFEEISTLISYVSADINNYKEVTECKAKLEDMVKVFKADALKLSTAVDRSSSVSFELLNQMDKLAASKDKIDKYMENNIVILSAKVKEEKSDKKTAQSIKDKKGGISGFVSNTLDKLSALTEDKSSTVKLLIGQELLSINANLLTKVQTKFPNAERTPEEKQAVNYFFGNQDSISNVKKSAAMAVKNLHYCFSDELRDHVDYKVLHKQDPAGAYAQANHRELKQATLKTLKSEGPHVVTTAKNLMESIIQQLKSPDFKPEALAKNITQLKGMTDQLLYEKNKFTEDLKLRITNRSVHTNSYRGDEYQNNTKKILEARLSLNAEKVALTEKIFDGLVRNAEKCLEKRLQMDSPVANNAETLSKVDQDVLELSQVTIETSQFNGDDDSQPGAYQDDVYAEEIFPDIESVVDLQNEGQPSGFNKWLADKKSALISLQTPEGVPNPSLLSTMPQTPAQFGISALAPTKELAYQLRASS